MWRDRMTALGASHQGPHLVVAESRHAAGARRRAPRARPAAGGGARRPQWRSRPRRGARDRQDRAARARGAVRRGNARAARAGDPVRGRGPFAGLAELLRPALEALERIPRPQASALAGALALEPATAQDRFAVGAATLSLLSAWAED